MKTTFKCHFKWWYCVLFGLAGIVDGLTMIFTLGYYATSLTLRLSLYAGTLMVCWYGESYKNAPTFWWGTALREYFKSTNSLKSQLQQLQEENERMKKQIIPETARQFKINSLDSEVKTLREALKKIADNTYRTCTCDNDFSPYIEATKALQSKGGEQ